MTKQTRKFQTFHDGVCRVCAVENTAPPGLRPKCGVKVRYRLRYQNRSLGVTRFYAAKAAQERVDCVIRVLRREDIRTDQVVILRDGEQYTVRMVQHPPDVTPPSTDLTLERIGEESRYDII